MEIHLARLDQIHFPCAYPFLSAVVDQNLLISELVVGLLVLEKNSVIFFLLAIDSYGPHGQFA